MRAICIVFLSLFVFGAAHAETLTIATFNTEFLTRPKVHIKFGLDFNLGNEPASVRTQWEQPGFRDGKFTEATAAVAEVLASLNADVLALTEVGDDADVTELRTAINARGGSFGHQFVCACMDNTTQQHVAVLSRFPLSETLGAIPGREGYYTELDDPETEKDTGISKGLRVSFLAYGQTFHLYVLHLASERGGYEQDQQRIAQASIARRHSLGLLNQDANVIVAGDFNDHPGEPTLRRLRGLDDIWPDLIQTGRVEFFDGNALDTRWTYQFQGVRQQIDHILVSYSIKDATRHIRTHTVDHSNALASDHRPLVVELDLR